MAGKIISGKGKSTGGTLCGKCKNASSCAWALFNRAIPGWKIERTTIRGTGGSTPSCRVIECPKFELDARSGLASIAASERLHWTKAQEQFLMSWYGRVPTPILAKALGRGTSAVHKRASQIRRRESTAKRTEGTANAGKA